MVYIRFTIYILLEHDIPILENKIFLLIFVHNKMSRKDKDIALFVAFCIEEYGTAKGLTGGQVHDLFSQYGVIDYLSKCYEPLHTQGRRWLMDEIDEFIAIRKNKKA